jgi:hypothetical protein
MMVGVGFSRRHKRRTTFSTPSGVQLRPGQYFGFIRCGKVTNLPQALKRLSNWVAIGTPEGVFHL